MLCICNFKRNANELTEHNSFNMLHIISRVDILLIYTVFFFFVVLRRAYAIFFYTV